MFDPNANPESVAARAAELSLEQLDRLAHYIKHHGHANAGEFYKNGWEIHISNQIAKLMGGYAVLVGLVSEDRISNHK